MRNMLLGLKSLFTHAYPRMYFADGTHMSFSQASKLLRKEGKLRSGPCVILDGTIIRDAVGVIENHQPRWEYDIGSNKEVVRCISQRQMTNQWFRGCVNTESDTQPKEVGYMNDLHSMKVRSKHMSKYFRDYTKNRAY